MSTISKRYVGFRDADGKAKVYVGMPGSAAVPLPPRNDLRDHSPDGFEWGYDGSGPAQLALAILADHFGRDDLAAHYYQLYKRHVIARLPGPASPAARCETWTIETREIDLAISEIQRLRSSDIPRRKAS